MPTPIYPISTATSFQEPETTVAAGPKTLGQNDFLKLLSVQMQSQDPMSPMQDTQFISQMANFTSLEQMKNLTASFNDFISQQRAVDAQSFLGKSVTVLDTKTGSAVTGVVSAVSIQDGEPLLNIGGKTYSTSNITAIHSSPPALDANTAPTPLNP